MRTRIALVSGWLAAAGCADPQEGSGSAGSDETGSTSATSGPTTSATLTTSSTSATSPTTTSTSETDSSTTSDSDDTSTSDASSSTTGEELPCNADGGGANKDRFVVVSHPYDENGDAANTYEVLLFADGDLAPTGSTFEMGRSIFGEITFTPSGRFGMVAQEDGTVGVFELDDAGEATVIDAAFEGDVYATGGIVMADNGDVAWVLDTQTPGNGGGIYRVAIDCDGMLTAEGNVAPGDVPYGLALLGDGRALVGARAILGDDSVPGANAYLLDWADDPTVLGAAVAFDLDDPIMSAVTLTADRRFGLLADNSGFSDVPNRIAVVEIGADDSLSFVQQLSDLDDPFDIVTSPFDDTAIYMSGFGNAVVVLDYDASGDPPFSIRGELEYDGPAPALPANAVMLERGDFEGRVFLSENVSVRQIQFEGDGAVTDLGALEFGAGLEDIVGVVGVQP